jgi:hypothetical protein
MQAPIRNENTRRGTKIDEFGEMGMKWAGNGMEKLKPAPAGLHKNILAASRQLRTQSTPAQERNGRGKSK